MIDTIEFKGVKYPAFQAKGGASLFCRPFALEVCKGFGLDIGYGKEEWKLPGSIGIDLNDQSQYDARNLPRGEYDYIHSSHLLEHLVDWVSVLDYWISHLKSGGVLFLYLPHGDQLYWRPFENRKHVNWLTAEMITAYMESKNMINIFSTTGRDLNHSFTVMGVKA